MKYVDQQRDVPIVCSFMYFVQRTHKRQCSMTYIVVGSYRV